MKFILLILDRGSLKTPEIVESIESDILLALQSRLHVSQASSVDFAKLLLLIVDIRGMTTQYLEAILDSPVQEK